MKIEEGKYYRTRDGRKVGPAKSAFSRGRFEFDGEWDHLHEADGTYCGFDPDLDLIAEWTDGPAFTVGAKVRVTSDSYGKEQLGKTGRVVEVGRSGSLDIEIEYDEPLIHTNGLKRNQYRSEDLELVEPTLANGPVRTVTRREVVPGVWSGVEVKEHNVSFDLEYPSSDALKAAAAVLLELAGALE